MLTLTQPSRPAGRPRDAQRHDAVLVATCDLLAEVGYVALTYSDVAARAGVTRQLIHRWWSSKPSLVAEALFTIHVPQWPTTYAGPLEADLRIFLQAIVDYACRPDVMAGVIGLMSEATVETELPGLDFGLLDPLRASLAALIDAGCERGDTRPEIDVDLTLNTLRGAATMHLIADRTPPDVVVTHLTEFAAWSLKLPS